MHSLPDDAATTATSRATKIVRAIACASALVTATLCVASAAHAGTGELTHATLHGLRAYFADPANVRGMVGAALGAIVSVLAARTFAPGGARDSDER